MAVCVCDRRLDSTDSNAAIVQCMPVKHKWDMLGTYLNVSRSSISAIRVEYFDSEQKMAEIISVWIRGETTEAHPSWRSLTKALEWIDRDLADKIARKHECSHTDCQASLQLTPHSTQDADMFNIIIPPSVTYKDVFRRHSSDIISLIVDPIRLGNDLASAGIVSGHVVTGLSELMGVSSYEKSSKLISEVARTLYAASDSQILVNFCRVLKKQQSQGLEKQVKIMLCELEGKSIADVVETTGTARGTAVLHTAVEPEISSTQPKQNISTEEIKKIFNSKEDALRSVFANNLLGPIAQKMFNADIIGDHVKNNPSYDNITKEFFDSLEFLDCKEMEQECSKFLTILYDVGGSTRKAVLWLQKELKKLGLTVNIPYTQS